jgi:hypothetical protein
MIGAFCRRQPMRISRKKASRENKLHADAISASGGLPVAERIV